MTPGGFFLLLPEFRSRESAETMVSGQGDTANFCNRDMPKHPITVLSGMDWNKARKQKVCGGLLDNQSLRGDF